MLLGWQCSSEKFYQILAEGFSRLYTRRVQNCNIVHVGDRNVVNMGTVNNSIHSIYWYLCGLQVRKCVLLFRKLLNSCIHLNYYF